MAETPEDLRKRASDHRRMRGLPPSWRELADTEDWLADTLEARDQAREEAEDWHLAADGMKHHFGCENNASTSGHYLVCNRCRAEQAEAERDALRTTLAAVLAQIGADDAADAVEQIAALQAKEESLAAMRKKAESWKRAERRMLTRPKASWEILEECADELLALLDGTAPEDSDAH